MKKTFEELKEMYENCDEEIFNCITIEDFDELYEECSKNIVENYKFQIWLESIEEYY